MKIALKLKLLLPLITIIPLLLTSCLKTSNHKHVFSGDADEKFYYGLCEVEDCGVFKSKQYDTKKKANKLTYNTFKGYSKKDVDHKYESIKRYLNSFKTTDTSNSIDENSNYRSFVNFVSYYYNPLFDTLLSYFDKQSYIAYINYSVTQDDKYANYYSELVDIAYTIESYRIETLKSLYETSFKDYIFNKENGFDEDTIDELINQDSSLVKQRSNIKARLVELESYDEVADDIERKSDTFYKAMQEYAELNNELASTYKDKNGNNKYNDYLDFVYETQFGRDYKAIDLEPVKDGVKELLKTSYVSSNNIFKNEEAKRDDYTELEKIDFANFASGVTLRSSKAIRTIGDYFAYIDMMSDSKINMEQTYIDCLKVDSIYLGEFNSAYQVDIGDEPFMYFGYLRSEPTTFVHEFGHYTYSTFLNKNEVTNSGRNYDILEFNSQGDEFLFLDYLKDKISPNVFNNMLSYSTINFCYQLALAFTVTEFEQIIYSALANDEEIPYTSYNDIYKDILIEYGLDGVLKENKFTELFIGYSGYYISYAISIVPAYSLYIEASKGNITKAIDAYVKGFTYLNDETKSDLTTKELYDYIGIGNPFRLESYESITEYMKRYIANYY